MSELHSREPEFTHIACGPFAKNRKTYSKI